MASEILMRARIAAHNLTVLYKSAVLAWRPVAVRTGGGWRRFVSRPGMHLASGIWFHDHSCKVSPGCPSM